MAKRVMQAVILFMSKIANPEILGAENPGDLRVKSRL